MCAFCVLMANIREYAQSVLQNRLFVLDITRCEAARFGKVTAAVSLVTLHLCASSSRRRGMCTDNTIVLNPQN